MKAQPNHKRVIALSFVAKTQQFDYFVFIWFYTSLKWTFQRYGNVVDGLVFTRFFATVNIDFHG